MSTNCFSQVQLGSDISLADGDRFGHEVAISANGNRIVVGEPGNDLIGELAGRATVFEWNGSNWTQLGESIYSGLAEGNSGYSVGISSAGDRIAIGEPYVYNDANSSAGRVAIFEWNGSSWNQLGDHILGEDSYDNSGSDISLSGNGMRVAIGASDNYGSGPLAGHVRVYEWNGISWQQMGDDIDGDAPGDRSGNDVALSSDGSTLAISSYFNDDGGERAGQVKIFAWSGDNWVQLGEDIEGQEAYENLGLELAMSSSGNRIAIQTEAQNNNDSEGVVRVFEWDDISWQQIGNDITDAGARNFGKTLAITENGNRIAVGAPDTDTRRGRVVVYDWIDDDWQPTGMSINGEVAFGSFGFSIDLSEDGTTIVIGAPMLEAHVEVYGLSGVSNVSNALPLEISVFPNPTKGLMTVDGVNINFVNIFDHLGRKVACQKGSRIVDLSDLSDGIYYLQIDVDGRSAYSKVIKK